MIYNKIFKKEYKKANVIIFLYFIFFLVIGLFAFKDFGISTDEQFHRSGGFYWLNRLLQTFSENQLSEKVYNIWNAGFGPDIESYTEWIFYPVLFDFPMAFIEVFAGITDSRDYILLRHIVNYFIFLLSAFLFYKILFQRLKDWRLSLIGTSFLILSPRILSNSFFNSKDILFLSLFIIAIYFSYNFIKKINLSNTILFSLFCALCSAQRIMGISIFLIVIFFFTLSLLSQYKENSKYIKFILLSVIFYFLFLMLFWPYLLLDPLNNFINIINIFFSGDSPGNSWYDPYILYQGAYLQSSNVPWHYLFVWISITTPILYLFFFLLGFYQILFRFIKKFIKIKDNKIHNDLWGGVYEKFDLCIFFLLTVTLFFVIKKDVAIYNGWRLFYYLYPLIIYISVIGLKNLYIYFFSKKKASIYFITISLYFVFICSQIISMHPHQNVYFNFLAGKDVVKKYDVDYWGVNNSDFLNKIVSLDSNNKINIATASYTNLSISKLLIDESLRGRINLLGQEYDNADYIFTNYMSEVNTNINKKYSIPSNFVLFYSLIVNNIKVYDVYKRK